jgi:hypothetical protein
MSAMGTTGHRVGPIPPGEATRLRARTGRSGLLVALTNGPHLLDELGELAGPVRGSLGVGAPDDFGQVCRPPAPVGHRPLGPAAHARRIPRPGQKGCGDGLGR